MDRLTAMQIFVRIVEVGSLSAAARDHGLSQPSVSRQLRSLERSLGARLLNRSTRHLVLTETGRQYYEDCRRILGDIAAAESNVGALQATLTGTLRVNTSVALGELYIVPIACRFQNLHPELTVDLTLNERFVDLVEEGIDIAIRFGALRDENIVARRLGSTRRVTVATPAYLRRHGTPETPADLAKHNCILFNYPPNTEWTYSGPRGEDKVKVKGRFRANNGQAIRTAILAGLGIAWIPETLIFDQMKAGAVKLLLTDYSMAPLDVHALYLPAPYVPAKARAFVDFLQEEFRSIPGFGKS